MAMTSPLMARSTRASATIRPYVASLRLGNCSLSLSRKCSESVRDFGRPAGLPDCPGFQACGLPISNSLPFGLAPVFLRCLTAAFFPLAVFLVAIVLPRHQRRILSLRFQHSQPTKQKPAPFIRIIALNSFDPAKRVGPCLGMPRAVKQITYRLAFVRQRKQPFDHRVCVERGDRLKFRLITLPGFGLRNLSLDSFLIPPLNLDRGVSLCPGLILDLFGFGRGSRDRALLLQRPWQ